MFVTLLAGVQKVELIGGESWFEHNFVAIAAITAAVLAALVAVMNQRAQLKHDRELRNRDHVRDTIDLAVVAATESRIVVDRFFAAVQTEEENRLNRSYSPSPERLSELLEKRKKALAGLHAMRAARTRLGIRLKESAPVLSTYVNLYRALVAQVEAQFKGAKGNRSDEARKEDLKRQENIKKAIASFQDACRNWLWDADSV